MIEQHYTGRQVAQLLEVDYETVLQLAVDGELESVRVGRLRRFPETSVERFLARHRQRNVVPIRPENR